MSEAWTAPETEARANPQELSGLFAEAWRLLKTNPTPVVVGFALGMTGSTMGFFVWYILVFAVVMAASLVGAMAGVALGLDEDGQAMMVSLFMLPAMIVAYLPLIFIIMGSNMVMARGALWTARGQTFDLQPFVQGLPRAIWVGTLSTLLMIVPLTFSVLLLYVPAIYLGLRWSLYLYYAVDTGLGPVDCLKASWRATEGKVLDLFIKHLVLGFGSFAVILFTCYLGMFVAVPFQMVVASLLYVLLSERSKPGLPDPVLS